MKCTCIILSHTNSLSKNMFLLYDFINTHVIGVLNVTYPNLT